MRTFVFEKSVVQFASQQKSPDSNTESGGYILGYTTVFTTSVNFRNATLPVSVFL